MAEIFAKQPCRSDPVAAEFAQLFADLAKPAPAPLDAGLVALVAKISTPQFRRLHKAKR